MVIIAPSEDIVAHGRAKKICKRRENRQPRSSPPRGTPSDGGQRRPSPARIPRPARGPGADRRSRCGRHRPARTRGLLGRGIIRPPVGPRGAARQQGCGSTHRWPASVAPPPPLVASAHADGHRHHHRRADPRCRRDLRSRRSAARSDTPADRVPLAPTCRARGRLPLRSRSPDGRCAPPLSETGSCSPHVPSCAPAISHRTSTPVEERSDLDRELIRLEHLHDLQPVECGFVEQSADR